MAQARSANEAVRRNKPLRDTARAVGGALLFSLPMLMTMEMWELGFTVHPLRQALLLVVSLPLLIELSHQIGFERTVRWRDDVMDALFAVGIGVVTAMLLLLLFSAIDGDTSLRELVGKLSLQLVPASMGALLARSQFGNRSREEGEEKEETYGGEMLLMGVGALFLGLNIAPTEEVVLIAYRMTPWHAFGLVVLSLLVMHGFVFAVGFRGSHETGPDTPWWSAFVRLTLPGYVLVLAISFYILWTFERTDGAFPQVLLSMIVLGLPSSVGAAAARLIL